MTGNQEKTELSGAALASDSMGASLDGVELSFDVHNTLEILEGAEILVVGGVAVAADKKVTMKDMGHVLNIMKQSDKLVLAVKDGGEVLDEVKDLDEQEVLLLGMAAYRMVKNIRKAYNDNKD